MKALMVDLNPDDPNGYGLAPMGGLKGLAGVTDCFGGMGLFMPAIEYSKILQTLLTSDGMLLAPNTVDLIFRPSLDPGAHAFINKMGAEDMGDSPLGAGLPKGAKREYGLGGMLVQQDLPGWYADGTLTWGGAFNTTWFIDRQTGLCGIGSPQMYLRDAPFTRGEGYEFQTHRNGALRWEAVAEHYKQVYRNGIYEVYMDWKEESQ